MTDDDKRAFFALIATTAEAYDSPALSKARLALMFDDLREFSIEQVAEALREHRKSCKWFPKTSELVERMRPNNEQAALVAWAAVLPLLRDSRNAFSADPITERVVQDLGGWTRIAHTDQDKLVWTEKEFVRRYQIYAEHGTDTRLLLGRRQGLRLIGRDA